MAKRGKAAKFGKRELDRAIAMRREGKTLRVIAKALGCSAQLVSLRLKEAEAAGERLPVAQTGRPRKRKAKPEAKAEPKAKAAKPAGAPAAAVPIEARLPEPRLWFLDDSPLPTDPDAALEELRARRLPELAKLARYALADGNLPMFRDAMKLEMEVLTRIRDATPPPEPDPEDDPANVEARDRVRDKIAELVERFEAA